MNPPSETRLHGKRTQTLSVRLLELESAHLPLPERETLERRNPVEGGFPVSLRLIYFFTLGFPLGMAWMIVGVALCCTLIGLPVGVWMLRRAGRVFWPG